MRMSDEVKFYAENSKYNSDTSEYDGDPLLVGNRMASVTDVGTTRSMELFGKFDQQAKVVRFIEPIDFTWSYLTIDGGKTHYVLQTDRKLLLNNSLIVGEVSE